MRQLTVSQKKLLNKAMAENPEIQTVEDLSFEIWERLEEINNTEVLWINVNSYLRDAYSTRHFGTRHFGKIK